MLIIKFIVTSIIFGVSSADVDNNNIPNGNFEYVVNEGSSCSDKISAILINEIDKLRDENKKILEYLEVINFKMDGSKKYIPDNMTIIETQQSYSQSHAPEKMITDNTDINNHKLSASEKKQPDLKENNITLKSKTTCNETIEKYNNDIIQKMNLMESKISKLENSTSYSKFNELEKKYMLLEDYFNGLPVHLWTELKKMIPDVEENIKNRLDTQSKKGPKYLEESENFKPDELDISNTFENFTELIAESLVQEDIAAEKTPGYWDCKELQAHGYNFKPIRMDKETLDHVTLKSDEDGLIYFEMHLAIKSAGLTVIQLSSEENPTEEDGYFAIGIADGHARSWLYNFKLRSDYNDTVNLYDQIQLQSARTPADIITTTEFKAFYVRIINETLEFGTDGTDTLPILKYRDARFRTMKYIGFTSWGDYYTGSFLFDCLPKF